MIHIKTPLRISLVGGGSDIASFYKEHGPGAVVSFTINKYVHVLVNRKFDNDIRVSYSRTENVNSVDCIQHDLVRECLKRMGIRSGIEIVSVADIPGKGTGLGSSSAFTIGLLNALNQFCILYDCGCFSALEDVAEAACEIEIEKCGKPIGKQDQYAVAYGGVNKLNFSNEGVQIQKIPYELILEPYMLLFWTGITRRSADILEDQAEAMKAPANVAGMKAMVRIAEELGAELATGNIENVGKHLHDNWLLKRAMAHGITNRKIDYWYNAATKAGAEGGKICGAGGGGFLLMWAEPDKHDAIRKAVGLRQIPFKIDPKGTRIAYMEGFSNE